MGLNISPAIVQSKIDEIFRVTYDGPGPKHGMLAIGNVVDTYTDDLICHSCEAEHAGVVAWVIKRLRAFNIQADPKKACGALILI